MPEHKKGNARVELKLSFSPEAYERLMRLSEREAVRLGLERVLEGEDILRIEGNHSIGTTIRNALRLYDWLQTEVYDKGYELAFVVDSLKGDIRIADIKFHP